MGSTDTDFDSLIRKIKQSPWGTLILILGPVGCGKTTLALKLMREINGSNEIRTIYNKRDLDEAESNSLYPSARVHMMGETINTSFTERVCGLANQGYIPILSAYDIYRIPRKYRKPNKDGVRSVLTVTFEKKGVFTAHYEDGEGSSDSSGRITDGDLASVKTMADAYCDECLTRCSWLTDDEGM